MFLLYHSEGCNICEMVIHEYYVNDLHTITCSGMLGHHIWSLAHACRDVFTSVPGFAWYIIKNIALNFFNINSMVKFMWNIMYIMLTKLIVKVVFKPRACLLNWSEESMIELNQDVHKCNRKIKMEFPWPLLFSLKSKCFSIYFSNLITISPIKPLWPNEA
jgi:hypothetical protein